MGFLFHGLDAKDFQRQYTDRELVRRFLARIGPFKLQLSLLIFFILLQTLAVLIAPLVLGITLDELVGDSEINKEKVSCGLLKNGGFRQETARPARKSR